MLHLPFELIDGFDTLYRNNLINSCSGFKSANLIGTKSNAGFENVAVFSSVTHYGSNPPILGLVMRPTTVARNTFENILETGFYTLNHIHKGIYSEAHHTSAKYPAEVSEFRQTDLNPEYKNSFYAPFVADCPVQIAMKYVEHLEIKINGTILVLGQIQDIFLEENLLSTDGFINLAAGNVVALNGIDGYVETKLINREPYARPRVLNETEN